MTSVPFETVSGSTRICEASDEVLLAYLAQARKQEALKLFANRWKNTSMGPHVGKWSQWNSRYRDDITSAISTSRAAMRLLLKEINIHV